MSLTTFRENLHPIAQQTVVLMKTSSVFVFRRHLDQGQYIRLGLTSSRRLQDVFKMSCKDVSQDIFKTSSNTSCRNIFNTSSRCLQGVFKTSSRRLQDIFKTSCEDVFKTFSRRIIKLNSSC